MPSPPSSIGSSSTSAPAFRKPCARYLAASTAVGASSGWVSGVAVAAVGISLERLGALLGAREAMGLGLGAACGAISGVAVGVIVPWPGPVLVVAIYVGAAVGLRAARPTASAAAEPGALVDTSALIDGRLEHVFLLSSSQPIVHSYADAGTYTIRAWTVNAAGLVASADTVAVVGTPVGPADPGPLTVASIARAMPKSAIMA